MLPTLGAGNHLAPGAPYTDQGVQAPRVVGGGSSSNEGMGAEAAPGQGQL